MNNWGIHGVLTTGYLEKPWPKHSSAGREIWRQLWVPAGVTLIQSWWSFECVTAGAFIVYLTGLRCYNLRNERVTWVDVCWWRLGFGWRLCLMRLFYYTLHFQRTLLWNVCMCGIKINPGLLCSANWMMHTCILESFLLCYKTVVVSVP